jgi:hypothetical protein
VVVSCLLGHAVDKPQDCWTAEDNLLGPSNALSVCLGIVGQTVIRRWFLCKKNPASGMILEVRVLVEDGEVRELRPVEEKSASGWPRRRSCS